MKINQNKRKPICNSHSWYVSSFYCLIDLRRVGLLSWARGHHSGSQGYPPRSVFLGHLCTVFSNVSPPGIWMSSFLRCPDIPSLSIYLPKLIHTHPSDWAPASLHSENLFWLHIWLDTLFILGFIASSSFISIMFYHRPIIMVIALWTQHRKGCWNWWRV